MKNLIKKLIRKLPVFIIFLSVVGYALYEYRKTLHEEESGDKTPLFSGKLEDVKKIHLSNKSFSLLIEKEKGDWFLKEPLKDFVDFTELSRWFRDLQGQKLKLISEQPGIQWEEYHLKDPSRVEITFSSDQVTAFSVSEKASFDGNWFIKKGNHLFLGEPDFGREVNEKTLNSYRSKKLLHSFGHPLTVKFQTRGHQPLNFTWKDSEWTYSNNKTFPLDTVHLNAFWTDLSSLKGSRISGPVTTANLKKFGLIKPFIEISLGFEKGKAANLIHFSEAKEGLVYGFTSTRDYILEISETDFEKILLSLENIRDHGQPFRYKQPEAFWLQLKGGEPSFIAQMKPSASSDKSRVFKKKEAKTKEKKESEWGLIEPKDKAIDSKEVKALLNAVYNLEGKKYKKGSIGKVTRSIEIKNKAGEVLFEMKVGNSYREGKDEFFGFKLTYLMTRWEFQRKL